tara:strand:- start:861 stop:2078 length:1218 start_codon:yes stop_codon:yes gene_type:complete
MKSLFILLSLIVVGKLLSAQEANTNCTNPKIIQLPLISNNHEIDEIYYELADEFTYWYQVIADWDCVLEYKMTVIEGSDDYEFLIYKPFGGRFCDNLILNNIKPNSFAKSGRLRLKKGEKYFFNVVYLNGNGCGHNLSLKTGGNELRIKAVQNECVEQVLEALVVAKIEEKIDAVVVVEPQIEIIEAPLIIENIIRGVVVNQNTGENLEATVVINELKETEKQQFYSKLDSGFTLKNVLAKELVVSIKKFGYQLFHDTINIETGSFNIELTPVAVGEKIVMRKVYFQPNTYVLKEESKPELNKLLKFMLENKDYSFEIQGHTNGNRAVKKTKRYAHLGEEWNFKGTSKKLSKLRAEKIKSFLIKNGVSENQLQTEGYGGDKMIVAKPKNMSQAMKNIRVEVIVLQ